MVPLVFNAMRKIYFLLGWIFLLCCATPGLAQSDELRFAELPQLVKPRALLIEPEGISHEELKVQRSMVALSAATVPGYYRDSRRFARLRAMEDSLRYLDAAGLASYLAETEALLGDYIQRFQIDNFTRDYRFLWLLGRVKESRGDTALAVLYYQLAKLHSHRDSLPLPLQHLDALLAPTRSAWTTIDEYYELLKVRARVDTIRPPRIRTNMGEYVNSVSADYAPYVHASDDVLIFTSRRDTSGMIDVEAVGPGTSKNEDLYYTFFNEMVMDWETATRFDNSINTEFNEGSACLSPDGITLFFTRCEPSTVTQPEKFRFKTGRADTSMYVNNTPSLQGYGSCDLYMAKLDRTTGGFTEVRNLGASINSEAWDSQPNLSADGLTLYFASNRKGGFGGTDLYQSRYDTLTQRWSRAVNLGPLINTAANESTPYFHRINATLYFSSMGHLFNYGDYDIFKSRFLGDRWELPHNVGPLINDGGSQEYFSISGDGKYIYYANANDVEQDRINQDFDLYSFKMPMEARPDADAILKGILRDSVTGYPLVGRAMVIDMEKGVEVAPRILSDSGYFEFNLINNRRYKLVIVGEDFLTINRGFEMTGDTTFNVMTKSFEEGRPFVFERLEFKSNSAKLSAKLKPNLDYLSRFLKNYPQFKLVVEGHTDADGPEARNQTLSRQRAERIRDYLLRKGNIDPTRISGQGYGETRPLVPNDTEENKSKNRRVEFKLIVDETYEGEIFWPSEEEFYFKDHTELKDDPEFDREFEWTPDMEEDWKGEAARLEETRPDPLDLEGELEDLIVKDIKKSAETEETPKEEAKDKP
jgi:flagellar motor protein MotB